MNLLLFETAEGAPYFVGETFGSSSDQPVPEGEDSRWQRLKRQIRSAYETLKDQFDYAERLRGSLRHADALRVVHSPRLTPDEVEKKLRDFLELGYSKHSRWLAIDGVLAGLGVGLFWLPGPNVFFFYPAVRALSHYFARDGSAHALRLKPAFERDGRLDRVQESMDNLESCAEELSVLEESYNLDKLSKILKNLQRK